MKILHLTLKRKWFDLIASGTKTEEYREIKSYWIKRLERNKTFSGPCVTEISHDYTHVLFRNGYAKSAPKFLAEINGISIGNGNKEWGAPNTKVYIIGIGKEITDA